MGIIDTLIGNTTYLILLILLIVYIPLYFYVRSSQGMRDRGIVPYGPFIMIKTTRGMRLLDGLAKYKRFWGFFGAASKIMALFLMAFITFIMIMNLRIIPTAFNSPGIGIEYALAIPGLNPMLPFWYALLGLIIAVVIHELAHGVQTRANNMKVESMGILHCVVPMGAFVEPNDEQIRNTSRKARSTVFAAGIAINLTVAIVLFLVMSVGLMGSMSSPVGDRAAVMNITAGSPAFDSGMDPSSVILQVREEGTTVWQDVYYSDNVFYDGGDMKTPFVFSLNKIYDIHYATKDGPENFAKAYMGVFIESVVKESPAGRADIQPKSFIVSINGEDVTSLRSFTEILSRQTPNSAPVDVVVQKYNGKDQPLGAPETHSIIFDDNNGNAFLGVTRTFSGFNLTTPDAVLAAAKNPFSNVKSVPDVALSALMYIGQPFQGKSPIQQQVMWWYDSSIMSDDTFNVVLQAVFWIFWLNLVLAIMNALPAVPFDGGYLFRDGVGKIVDRTHRNSTAEKREKIVNATTNMMSYAMIFILMLVMVAVIF
ncbi:MAG: site-2 protease family protein [Methanomassiliicoccaceae archaeon]|jgi:membrane-associated protease RseP (regulator of RpoE activity)|nr:site-2 protease family protein [Methanomassiliicoccaceae archaeon]